jgi:hypothetical protein
VGDVFLGNRDDDHVCAGGRLRGWRLSHGLNSLGSRGHGNWQ